MDEALIGARLSELRRRHRLSLRALSRAAGVAPSFISGLEQGNSSVSVATLKAILDVFGVGLGEFFSPTQAAPAKVVYRKDELVELAGQRGVSYREVAAGQPGRALQLLLEHYEPGADTGSEKYHHDAEEAGLVLSGKLELTVEDEVFVLGPGDAYYFDSRRPHRFRNIGKSPVKAVSVNSPPSF